MDNENNPKKKRKGGGAAVTGIAVLAALAALFGSGKLGFGDGFALGQGSEEKTEQVESTENTPDAAQTAETETEAAADVAEIRVQGREYNYQNVTYGTAEHTLDDLLAALDAADRSARIDLIVEDNASKNAVDDLVAKLTEAGFIDIRQ